MVRHTTSLEWGGWDGHNVTNDKQLEETTNQHSSPRVQTEEKKTNQKSKQAKMKANMKAKKQGSKAAEQGGRNEIYETWRGRGSVVGVGERMDI